MIQKSPNDTNKVFLLIELGNTYVQLKQFDSALNYFNKASHFANTIKYIRGYGSVLANKINFYIYNQSQPDSAFPYIKAFEDYAVKYNRKRALFFAFSYYGAAYTAKGEYANAMEPYLHAQKLADQNKNSGDIAAAHFNTGVTFSYLNDRVTAIKEFNIADSIYNSIGDTNAIVGLLFVKGIAYGALGQIKSALDCHLKRIRICEQRKWYSGVASGYNEMAQIFGTRNKPKALEYSLKAYEFFKKEGDPEPIANTCTKLAGLFNDLGRYTEAKIFAEELVLRGRQINNRIYVMEGYDQLATMYLLSKQFEKACGYFRISRVLRDSLYNEKMTGQFAEMSKKYETEKKNKELLAKESEIKIQQADANQKSTQRNFFIGGFGIMVIMSFLVLRGYNQKKKANKEISEQKHIIEEKQKEILDSIHYAKKIQQTLLASKQFMDENVIGSFILFKPKDIVSGDFYWAAKHNGKFFLAVCDSTGHGVPGAFMSLLSMGFLSEAIKEKDILDPGEVFNFVRKRLEESISKEEQKDGFDGILFCKDEKTGKLCFAAANNKPVIVSNGQIKELSCDKMPVGKGEIKAAFKTYELEISAGDVLYLYTDGFADQFGGPRGKKFKYKQLDEILTANYLLALEKQEEILNIKFQEWKGSLEQVDDVCVVGIKI